MINIAFLPNDIQELTGVDSSYLIKNLGSDINEVFILLKVRVSYMREFNRIINSLMNQEFLLKLEPSLFTIKIVKKRIFKIITDDNMDGKFELYYNMKTKYFILKYISNPCYDYIPRTFSLYFDRNGRVFINKTIVK